MSQRQQFKPGVRVRLHAAHFLVDLRSPTGTIVRPDTYDDYFVVRLDEPAVYHNADGTTTELTEICEAFDNMDVVDAPKQRVGHSRAITASE